MLLVAFQNCSDVGFTDAPTTSPVTPPEDFCDSDVEDCTPVQNSLNNGNINHTQPAAEAVSKVDILFVTDTS